MTEGVGESSGAGSSFATGSASRAGANSVMHNCAPESCCPSSSRIFHAHCARIWANRLSAWGMRVPTICVLLLVFVSQHGLKRATMQVQVKHIRSSKRRGRKRTHKQFVNHVVTLDTDCGRRSSRTVSRNDHAHLGSSRRQGNGWAIVEGTRHPTFWMGTHLILVVGKGLLNHREIQQVVSTTSGKYAKASGEHIEEWGSITIETIETEQHGSEGKR